MTPKSQRIAIASTGPEWRALVYEDREVVLWYDTDDKIWRESDPLHDLNAMHESLKSQDRRFNFLFSEELDKTSTLRGCYVHELTAKDWANCFIFVLQTLGLWKEEPVSEATVEGLR